MAGFTKEEIAAEFERREKLQLDIETGRSQQAERIRIADADTECMHCHTPCNSVTGGAHGLCDLCLYNDN